MKNSKFMAGDVVYVAGRRGRDGGRVTQYTFVAYSEAYPGNVTLAFMVNDTEHRVLLRTSEIHATRRMAQTAEKMVPERKRKAYVAPMTWALPRKDYKQYDI